MSNEEMCEFMGADSLAYLTQDALLKSVASENDEYCTACFTGKYLY